MEELWIWSGGSAMRRRFAAVRFRGREAEQDIEVVREEIVQEYLQGVRIVERHTDEEAKTCSATAVMAIVLPCWERRAKVRAARSPVSAEPDR